MKGRITKIEDESMQEAKEETIKSRVARLGNWKCANSAFKNAEGNEYGCGVIVQGSFLYPRKVESP